jgi:hypothetical protein
MRRRGGKAIERKKEGKGGIVSNLPLPTHTTKDNGFCNPACLVFGLALLTFRLLVSSFI